MSDNSGAAYLLIGAMKAVARESLTGLTIEKALLKVANEIQYGLSARESGLTERLTHNDLLSGKFIGKSKDVA